jgi:hypothetical protein
METKNFSYWYVYKRNKLADPSSSCNLSLWFLSPTYTTLDGSFFFSLIHLLHCAYWSRSLRTLAKVSNFNTCHNCKEFHDDKQNNYQNYDKSDVSAFADSVRSFKKPIVINIDNVSATITTTTTTPPITSWMYDKDAWINMTNHFFDQCCTIEEDEEFENDNNNSSAMVIRRTITIHQSRSTQERKKRSSAVHTNHNNPTNKGCNVSRTDIDAFVTNFDNLDVLVQFWSEFIKRNPNEAFRTNEWGGVFDILR